MQPEFSLSPIVVGLSAPGTWKLFNVSHHFILEKSTDVSTWGDGVAAIKMHLALSQ